MSFKEGDEVRVIKQSTDSAANGKKALIGKTYIIKSIGIYSEWPYSLGNAYGWKDEELELATTKKSKMQKLTPMLRKLLDPSAQKQYKAGFLNGDLELTEKGKTALLTVIYDAHKKELDTLADDVIAEDKEDKK